MDATKSTKTRKKELDESPFSKIDPISFFFSSQHLNHIFLLIFFQPNEILKEKKKKNLNFFFFFLEKVATIVRSKHASKIMEICFWCLFNLCLRCCFLIKTYFAVCSVKPTLKDSKLWKGNFDSKTLKFVSF